MPYRICSISGGGVKGIIPAVILKEMLSISKSLGGTGGIADLCDYIAGTSVGGILGAALASSEDKGIARDKKKAKFSADEVVDLIKDNAETIFPKDGILDDLVWGGFIGGGATYFINPVAGIVLGSLAGITSYLYTNTQLIKPKYSRDGIDKLLDKYFGDLKLSDAVIPFTVASYSLDKDGPRIWSTFRADKDAKDDFYIKDALGATSAAPTYFPAKHTITEQGDYYDIDGGIFANSPLSLAITVLNGYAPADIKEKVHNEGIFLLSLGTGHAKKAEFAPPSLLKQGALFSVIDLLLKTIGAAEKDSLAQADYYPVFMRLDPVIGKELTDMDNPANVPKLLEAAEHFVGDKSIRSVIESYVKCLYHQAEDDCNEIKVLGSQEHELEINDL